MAVTLQSIPTVFINLAHRTDRLQHIVPELTKMGIDRAVRLDAVKLDRGALGCTLSHCKAIKEAKANNWPYVLIVEDDFQWRDRVTPDTVQTCLNEAFQHSSQWDLLFFACRPFEEADFVLADGTSARHLRRVMRAYTSSGYIVQQHYYDTLLQNLEEGAFMFDQFQRENHGAFCLDRHWECLQRKDRWLRTEPRLGKQLPGYSDITKSNVAYEC